MDLLTLELYRAEFVRQVNDLLAMVPHETSFTVGVLVALTAFLGLVYFMFKKKSTGTAATEHEMNDLLVSVPDWERDVASLPLTEGHWEIGVSKRAVSVAEEGLVRLIYVNVNEASTTFSADKIYAILLKAMVHPEYEGSSHKPGKPKLAVFLPSSISPDSVVHQVSGLMESHGIRVSAYEPIAAEVDALKAKRREKQFNEEREMVKEKIKASKDTKEATKAEMDPQPPRHCFKCKKLIPGKASQCSACKAIIYCSADCAKEDWSEHKQLCPTLKEHMLHVEQHNLHDFPFTFYNPKKILASYNQVNLLIQHGVHNVGLFKRLCGCYRDVPYGQLWFETMLKVQAAKASNKDIFDVHGLMEEMFPLAKTKTPGSDVLNLKSWKELFELKEWSFDNPAALILHVPMTIYHLINTYHLNTAEPLLKDERRRITIHLVGVENEADMLPLFEILLGFYAKTDICIHFIGPAVSPSIPPEHRAMAMKSQVQDSSLFMTVQTGLYGPSQADGSSFKLPDHIPEAVRKSQNFGDGKPDLIIILNPNLLAYTEWVPTIQFLFQTGQKVVFTDGMEQIVESIDQNLKQIKAKLAFKATPNPFKQPVYLFNPEVNLPAWQNGFIFGMGKFD